MLLLMLTDTETTTNPTSIEDGHVDLHSGIADTHRFEFNGRPIEYCREFGDTRALSIHTAKMLQAQGVEIFTFVTNSAGWFLVAAAEHFDALEAAAKTDKDLADHMLNDKFFSFSSADLAWAFGLVDPTIAASTVRAELMKGAVVASCVTTGTDSPIDGTIKIIPLT